HYPAKGVQLTLRSIQKLVMPVTVRVDLADGSHLDRRVPVETWLQNTAPTLTLPTTQKVLHVRLDPDHVLPDAQRGDNQLDVIG
ncbi:M1 family peptidase, partial [Xanthomonas hortorum pv. gardneri]